MRIVAYLRVSTDRQAETGLGLEVQKQAIEAWARKHGYKITAWYSDEGISGSNGLDSRDALPAAIADIRARRADGIVIYRLDRLARDLITQEVLLRELAQLGADVYSTFAGEQEVIADDPADPSRRLIRQVLGAVAEYEKSLIRLRLASGRRRKHERGGFAYGSPSYGFEAMNGELVPVAAEQAVLGRIRSARAGGASWAAIAAVLNGEGIPAKRGGRWHARQVQRLIDPVARQAARASSARQRRYARAA